MILKTTKQNDYELIDTGEGFKLERYGSFVMSRPDPEALWKKKLSDKEWQKIDLEFIRSSGKNNLLAEKARWIIKNGIPNNWIIEFGGLKFLIKPTSFKHIGIFPEQLPNWQWMEELIRSGKRPCLKGAQGKALKSEPVSVLNLFAYTGGATLACAKAGAEVCHVDGSKSAVDWARKNGELSGLGDAPIRWLIEDVTSFIKREIKRGRKYDAIIMDPPSFGHGPKDELWKIEENFLNLLDLCRQVLSDDPLFILINGYTAGYSSIVYENNLHDLMKEHKGKIESGELVIEESTGGRLLPCGIFARWSKD